MTAMFSKPKMPKREVAPPDPDDTGPIAVEARRRRLAEVTQRSGRESTMLTRPPTVMGDYTSSRTG
jgi:hypothetical protein